ncbi:MAG: hypothetical protein ACRETA_06760 [Gammaproteobacteria bacterium]
MLLSVIGVDVPTLIAWKNSGLSPIQATIFNTNNVPIAVAPKLNKVAAKYCKTIVRDDFDRANPYSTIGKCYLIQDYQVSQILNRNVDLLTLSANYVNLFGVNGQTVFAHWNGDAPGVGVGVNLLIKSIGIQHYTEETGADNVAVVAKVLMEF